MNTPPSRVCYLLMCHKDRELVLRAARAIKRRSPHASVLIRHDRVDGFIERADAEAAGALLHVSGVRASWGSWNLVEAELQALNVARSAFDPDWVVVVSGQDYPAGDLAGWERRVLRDDVDAIVDALPLAPAWSDERRMTGPDTVRSRYVHRWARLPRLPVRPPELPRRALKALWYRHLAGRFRPVQLHEYPRQLGWLIGVPSRRAPFGPELVGWKGSQWKALGRRALEHVLEPDGEAARLASHYRSSLIPDEGFLPTVLHNARHLQVLNAPVTYVDFAETPHAAALTVETLPAALAQGTPFVRKVDSVIDPRVADVLDALE